MPFKDKTVPIKNFIDSTSKSMFGRSASESMLNKICVTCGHKVGPFKDELSEREYEISGICQECQDEIFGKEI